MSRRMGIILICVLVALVIAVVVLIVVLNGMHAAGLEADYRACLESRGLYDETNLDTMTETADACYRAVYGE